MLKDALIKRCAGLHTSVRPSATVAIEARLCAYRVSTMLCLLAGFVHNRHSSSIGIVLPTNSLGYFFGGSEGREEKSLLNPSDQLLLDGWDLCLLMSALLSRPAFPTSQEPLPIKCPIDTAD